MIKKSIMEDIISGLDSLNIKHKPYISLSSGDADAVFVSVDFEGIGTIDRAFSMEELRLSRLDTGEYVSSSFMREILKYRNKTTLT